MNSTTAVSLKQIAYARSGDKGRNANVGLIAHTEDGYKFLCDFMTEERVLDFFSTLPVTKVTRYEMPNLWALNFILHDGLGKGGSRSLAIDAQGKALGQALLTMTVDVETDQLAKYEP